VDEQWILVRHGLLQVQGSDSGVDVLDRIGISRKVVSLTPIANIKG
jgi:hypothetical protein